MISDRSIFKIISFGSLQSFILGPFRGYSLHSNSFKIVLKSFKSVGSLQNHFEAIYFKIDIKEFHFRIISSPFFISRSFEHFLKIVSKSFKCYFISNRSNHFKIISSPFELLQGHSNTFQKLKSSNVILFQIIRIILRIISKPFISRSI